MLSSTQLNAKISNSAAIPIPADSPPMAIEQVAGIDAVKRRPLGFGRLYAIPSRTGGMSAPHAADACG